jgi:3-hydroxybutyryl-CoA dehydratase
MTTTTKLPTHADHAAPIARWMEIWGVPQSSFSAVDAFDNALDAWNKAWQGPLSAWAPGGSASGYLGALVGWPISTGSRPAEPSRAARTYPPGRSIDALEVGEQASFTKLITQAEIDAFAQITGDINPVHIDEAWAATSVFEGRISHGLLTAGLISATIGMQLPGPGTIYLSQSLRWTAPVRAGDTLTCTVTIKELVPEKNRAVLTTVVSRDGVEVLTGEALVMPPKAAS